MTFPRNTSGAAAFCDNFVVWNRVGGSCHGCDGTATRDVSLSLRRLDHRRDSEQLRGSPPHFRTNQSLYGPETRDVQVTSRDVLGETGNLTEEPDAVFEDYFGLKQNEANPMSYRGEASLAGWATRPGTYYWQITAQGPLNVKTYEMPEYQSPVYTLIVAEQAPTVPAPQSSPPTESVPSVTAAEAYPIVKRIIKERTKHTARHLADRCHQEIEAETVCSATWATDLLPSASTLLYSGTFHLHAESSGLSFSFAGLRERYSCARHYSVKHCASRVHWD